MLMHGTLAHSADMASHSDPGSSGISPSYSSQNPGVLLNCARGIEDTDAAK